MNANHKKELLTKIQELKEEQKKTNSIIASAVQERKCERCKAENKLYEILKILQWRGCDNMLSGLAYDKESEQILINKDSLMRAIQYANPGQAYRDIRLVTHEEYKAIKDKRTSDYTSDREKIRKEKAISAGQ